MRAERGFSLIEVLVVVAVMTMLTFSVLSFSLARHPAALLSATRSFDASLAAARAIAATSGNGATIVIAPRTQTASRKMPLPGFVLTVYRGRPISANAVSATTIPPVTGDVSVKEATLGTPPFAIFLSSAGRASGLGSYPSFDDSGKPVFPVVTRQPACTSSSLTLTFFSATATQTRALSCDNGAVGASQPVATPAPLPIRLTPSTLIFYWPSAPRQNAIATEWGYTRWFAANAFTCGANVAVFPQTDPAPPYSAAYSSADATASPQPPANVPYAFANSTASMEDAPASLPVVPQNAGACGVPISDANGQQTALNVQVMGQLTLSVRSLLFTAGGAAQTVTLAKTFDSVPLQGAVISSTCAGIASLGFSSGTAPGQPGAQPATATLTVTPQNIGTCSAQIGDQYSAAGDPAATLDIMVIAPPTPTPPLCPVGTSTLQGTDGSCDDLYAWPVDSYECSIFDCAVLFMNGNGRPTTENAWAGVYVPHGTAVNYDEEMHLPPYVTYTCYVNVNSAVSPVVFAYFYSDGSHPSQAVANPAGFGLAQLSNAASIPLDPAPPTPFPPLNVPAWCESRFPAPTL